MSVFKIHQFGPLLKLSVFQKINVPMPKNRYYFMKYRFIAVKQVYDIIARNKLKYN